VAGSAALSELKTTPATEFALAQPDDDAELRALLRRSVIPGAVRIAFTREPNYFGDAGLAGRDDVTLTARRAGQLVGMGRCSVHTLFRNGRPRRIGYLGELRVDPRLPATPRMLRDGYQFLSRHVSADGFFTSIASDNERARRVLERGAAFGLPAYEKLCDLVTLVAPVRTSSRRPDATTREGDLVPFLANSARQSHLTLAWTADQWRALAGHGIRPQSFAIAHHHGRIAGAAAIWDQRRFRQTVVDGYTGGLSIARPLINTMQMLRGCAPLPPPGSVLAQGVLLGAGVVDPDDWRLLWPALEARAAAMELQWLAIARDARDADLPVLRRLLRAREYRTALYAVAWHDGPSWPEPWDTRYFRPEVALL
jgi:hypothetical protein